ncbi:MAG: gamma-glutamylcyclotransferase [Gemmatimonadetes bacterium]|nr:gamma-glutamylcyclotransferase [Gemmatimonadota bacterium]
MDIALFAARHLAELHEVNAQRAAGAAHDCVLEAAFASAFGAHQRLAVYGSLAPGQPHHGQLAMLAGRWSDDGVVHGELLRDGWGATLGFPGLRWQWTGPPHPVQLLHSVHLPDHWTRLDQFEGGAYLRILVPIVRAGQVMTVANLYALRENRRRAYDHGR